MLPLPLLHFLLYQEPQAGEGGAGVTRMCAHTKGFTSDGLGAQLLVVELHTRPRCRSPEFLVIETPALEGAAAEYRGMRLFACNQPTILVANPPYLYSAYSYPPYS